MKRQLLSLIVITLSVAGAHAAQSFKEPCSDTPNRVMCMLKSVSNDDVASQTMIAMQIRIFGTQNPGDPRVEQLNRDFIAKYKISVDGYLKQTDVKTPCSLLGAGGASMIIIALVGTAIVIPAVLLGLFVYKRYRGRGPVALGGGAAQAAHQVLGAGPEPDFNPEPIQPAVQGAPAPRPLRISADTRAAMEAVEHGAVDADDLTARLRSIMQ